ncbi:hypothetical protein Z046_32480 [Pseudomonas aeruginosa VRFPA09]|nr:hypothetical protein Z046_32480 [Pseudomonas aeruginosa VRFPA09]
MLSDLSYISFCSLKDCICLPFRFRITSTSKNRISVGIPKQLFGLTYNDIQIPLFIPKVSNIASKIRPLILLKDLLEI